jgi:simple sugar transport system substrate-binding protein
LREKFTSPRRRKMNKSLRGSLPFIVILAMVLGSFLAAQCGPPPATQAPAPTEAAKTEAAKTEAAPAGKKYEIATVVKITGIPWFNRLEEGVKQAATDLDVNAYQVGPAQADPAQQVKVVEDLVSKGVNAIAVVPNDAKSLEPVFAKAKEKGIIILTHESPDQKGNDYDLELIDNVKFGQHHWDMLVKFMGDSGDYAIFVGSLTVPLHNLWADEGLKYAKEKYPNLHLVTDRIPCGEDQELSKQKTLELIKAYPNLKGIVGFGSLGPPGAAQALEEKGLCDKIAVVGTVIPGHAAPYLKNGCLKHGILWDPKDAGYGLTWVAKQMLDGQKITDGMEIPDVGKIKLTGNVIGVDAMVDITKDNVDSFGF